MIRRVRSLVGHRAPVRRVHLVQCWSIGIYEGPSPYQLFAPASIPNPVLTRESVTDIQAQFVADPFMLEVAGTWYMFFEVMNQNTGRGEIGLATSQDGARWTYRSIVLQESFHLSYPYVFDWDGQYFMVPESYQAGAVRLYRAERFPYEWRLVGTLLEGPFFVDASPFRTGDRWWMFVETNPEIKCDTLRLFSSNSLETGWIEHPASPIVAGDPHTARPAGRVLIDDGRIVRFAQDCAPRYGLSVSAFDVIELSATTYRERKQSPSPLLGAGELGWNRMGMHHIDAHRLGDGRWIACVDGWIEVAYNPL